MGEESLVNMSTRPQSEELIAPCGINCGACKYYLTKTRGLYKSNRSGCIGCIPRDKGCTYQGGCEPLNKRAIRFCYECSNFPCDKLQKLNKRYSTKYHTNLLDNLMEIKNKGLKLWLGEEERKWKCTNCGGMVSIHTHCCFDCGVKQST